MKTNLDNFIPSIETKNLRIAICASRFNSSITSQLAHDAKTELFKLGLQDDNVKTFWVPGAFEIPLTAKLLAQSNNWDAVICLGAVIRGETPHFEYVSNEVARGLATASYESEIPIIFGVLTTNNFQEAEARTSGKVGRKGQEAAQNAVEMVQLLRNL